MNKHIRYKTMLIMIAAVVLLAMTGCDHNRLYETNIPVAGEKWGYDDVKTFTVEIKDTTTRYNIYINLRHSFLFDWRNIYVKIGTQLPDGKKLDKRVNLPLCETDGKWYGSCLGDNCDIPVMIQHDARFPQVGRYTFSIRQDMRVNPLDKIKSVGLRVEKAIVKQQQ